MSTATRATLTVTKNSRARDDRKATRNTPMVLRR